MRQTKPAKRSLFMSVLSLLLCCAMLMGSTFAWFSDTASTGHNTIVAGNLDVELYYAKSDGTEEKVDGKTDLFQNAEGQPILWEPGAMAYETLTVKNEGTLALKYALTLKTIEKNSVSDKTLEDVIKVAVIRDELKDIKKGEETGRESIKKLIEEKSLTLTSLKELGNAATGYLLPEDKAATGGSEGKSEEKLTVVLYWEPSANDNDYNLNNGKTATPAGSASDGTDALYIKFGVNLFATQYNYEPDDFGPDYDKDAPDADGKNIPITYEKTELPGGSGVTTNNAAMTFLFQHEAPLPAGEDGDTTVELEASALPESVFNEEAESHTVELTVHTDYQSMESAVPGESTVPVAVIDLTLLVDGNAVHNFETGRKATITTYLEKDLEDVKVFYEGEEIDEKVTYEPETGKLTFQTTHFSEFVVKAKKSPKFTIHDDSTLREALAAVKALGDPSVQATLTLDGDVTLASGATLTLESGNVTLDLAGHNLTIQNGSNKGLAVSGGAKLKFTDAGDAEGNKGTLTLGTKKNSKQAITVSATSSKKTSVTFEDINITVENTAHNTYGGSYANGNVSAICVNDYATVTFGEGAVITAEDGKSLQCDAYVAYANGSRSVINIDGADVTVDGTVTPFAAGNGTLNMKSGTITISSNNGSAALMVARGSGEVNMTGGTINVTGDLTGGNGAGNPVGWGYNFRNICFGVATSWTADDDEAQLNVSGGVINLTPTNGTAVGVSTAQNSTWSAGHVNGTAVINCEAAEDGIARAVGAFNGSPLDIKDSAVINLIGSGNNAAIASESPFQSSAVMDRRTNKP